MVLIDFLRQASPNDLRLILLLTLLSGAANALLVLAVNQVTTLVAHGERPALVSCAIYILAFAAYYQTNKLAMLRANAVIERLLKNLRLQVMDRIRRSELAVIGRLGQGHLYTLVSQETNHLSVAFPMVIDSLQQAILLAISLLYLAWLSPAALLAFGLAVLVGAIAYRGINSDLGAAMRRIAGRQGQMLDAIGNIVDGAKELRLNRRKADDVLARYRKVSNAVETLQVLSGDHWAALLLLGSFVTYLLLGTVAFGFPSLTGEHGIVLFQLIPLLLFCMGPLTRIVAQSPMFVRADVGLRAILEVDRQLEEAGGIAPDFARALAPAYRQFERIAYARLLYSYRGAGGVAEFTVGPLDLTLARGELLFLVGGNGSGKSTVMRLITGLYTADSGTIAVDGMAVAGKQIAGLRELFSAIFVDFHLFDRLYGLEHVDPGEVNALIAEMGLGNKVRFENGRFTRLSLSTGQRKRLALIAALLEDREIYVFDEWSAEQDVHFREFFYTGILPGLRAKGKTVVAVTHDERFWYLADRVIKMELGRVVWERAGKDLEPS